MRSGDSIIYKYYTTSGDRVFPLLRSHGGGLQIALQRQHPCIISRFEKEGQSDVPLAEQASEKEFVDPE